MLVGGEVKTRSMETLFLLPGRKNHKKVHLRLVPGTKETSYPILIADCELHNEQGFRKAITGHTPGVIDQRRPRWQHSAPSPINRPNLARLLYTRLISPFCTTISLFADDLGGINATAKLLVSWLGNITTIQSTPVSDLPESTYPMILVLMTWTDQTAAFDEKLATTSFLMDLRYEIERLYKGLEKPLSEISFNRLLESHFSGIKVLALPPHAEDQSLDATNIWLREKALRTRLFQESQDMQARRRASSVAFSATHFEAFLHSAFVHFADDVMTPFSFVKASRIANPIPRDFPTHLSNFLRCIPRDLSSFAPNIIASALTLDGYPPGMHSKYRPCG
jgi:hypothetical protein